jgi:predicted N-acetyltransferase YhbS
MGAPEQAQIASNGHPEAVYEVSSMTTHRTNSANNVVIRPVLEGDLDEVDLIFRRAFGTFFGVEEPEKIFGDTELVRTRWLADPGAGYLAELNSEVVGSNFITTWGSFGFLGPLTVRPDCWDRGIAHRLMEATMELFASRETSYEGLFTFSHSPKHIVLYQRFGFWPRFLIAVMEASVAAPAGAPGYSRFSELASRDRAAATAAVRDLTGAIFAGLDVSREIDAVFNQNLGETLLLDDGSGLQAAAVCHIGPGTEAGSGMCYLKFAAARPGPDAPIWFGRMIDACHDLAASSGAAILQAGVNFGRVRAYEALVARGFRTQFQGVSMHRPNEDAYDTTGTFVLDDWR